MTPEQFIKHLLSSQSDIKKLIASKLPRLIGKHAVDHFRENFAKGGFVNEGLQRWDRPKRFNAKGKSAGAKYGTLLSARKELYNSISFEVGTGTVTVTSDKEYAAAQNDGFNGVVTVPEHTRTSTRKTTVFSIKTHKSKKVKTEGYRFMVRAHKRKMNLPQRQFIGNSKELNDKIQTIIETELSKIF